MGWHTKHTETTRDKLPSIDRWETLPTVQDKELSMAEAGQL